MTKNDVDNPEWGLLYEDDSNETPPTDVFTYNDTKSCAEINRMTLDGDIEIRPDFQRDIVWKNASQTKFIDSLIKELPIPSLCISLDASTQKWKIIDGLQRITTINKFLNDDKWKLSNSPDIDERLSGKVSGDIKKKHPTLLKRVKNFSLPITVLRCDYSRPEHYEYIFTIFSRLNSGGMKLTNQEIRNAIFPGPLNETLKRCSQKKEWLSILGIPENKEDRYRNVELVLRFIAFKNNHKNYSGRLTSFLNDYMKENRSNLNKALEDETLFEKTSILIQNKIIDGGLFKKPSAILVDALMFGVASNLELLESRSKTGVKKMFNKMLKMKPFTDVEMREGLAKKDKVLNRLTAAKKAFSK